MSATVGSTTNNARVDGAVDIFWGALFLSGWLWGNMVQIKTNEAWFLHSGKVEVTPDLSIFGQWGLMFGIGGHLTWLQFCAYSASWIIQFSLVALSIGLERHLPDKTRRTIFIGLVVTLIGINALGDLITSGSAPGTEWWQPWVFAGAMFVASFGFGMLAIHCLARGIHRVIFGH